MDPAVLSGTTQNDIMKEYLSRGTFIFPPIPSRRLTVDTIAYTVRHVPKWNPINVCSYHLQEAGATPHQEVAYALATAIGVLDAVRPRVRCPRTGSPRWSGRISFFVNAGVRFVEETCKMRAFTALWERICTERYGVDDAKLKRMRYGVQVNSLGLTEAQPENNVPRIVLEALGVTLSKRARARALQLPAWNEALGLPRPWDQQWSLRIQQILAFESDLLEYEDIFDGSIVIEKKTAEVADAAWAELEDVLALGGAFEAIDEIKSPPGGQPGRPGPADRDRRAPGGGGQLLHRDGAVAAVTPTGEIGNILRVDPAVELELREPTWPPGGRPVTPAPCSGPSTTSVGLPRAPTTSCRPPSPWPTPAAPPASGPRPCARCSASTGPPPASGAASATGAPSSPPSGPGPGRWPTAPGARPGCWWPSPASTATPTAPSRSRWRPGTPASRSSTRASGSPPPRSPPPRGTRTSTWWGSPSCRAATSSWCPTWSTASGRSAWTCRWWSGGSSPRRTPTILEAKGVARVYTPKDFEIGRIMDDLLELAEQHRAGAPV